MHNLGTVSSSAPSDPQHRLSGSDIAHSVIQHLRDGVAWCRMVYEDGVASDLVFVHTNPAFQHHTGLCPSPGQRLSELLPGLRNTDAALFDSFARVAAGGPAETLQRFIVALGQWFSGQLYSPQAGDVIAIFSEDSARQLAKQHLATTLAEQHAILDTNLVGLVKTRQRHVTWANSAAVELFGYPLAELLGQTTERLYPTKAEFDRFAEVGLPVVRAGGVYRGESQVRRKDGSLRWFLHQATQLTPGSDDHVSSFIDISARVEAEAALLRSEARLSSTFAAMAEGVVLQGADGRIVDANPAAERILGLTRDQLRGRRSVDPLWQAVHEDGSPFPSDDHPGSVVLRTGQPQRGQVMGVTTPDLGQRWISVNADPVRYSRGAQPEGVVATFTDITELHAAREQLRRLVLDQRAMLDHNLLGIMKVRSRVAVWTNRAMTEMFGYAPDELLQLPARQLYLDDESHAWIGASAYPELQAGRTFHCEIEMRRKDGQSIWIDLRGMQLAGDLEEALWLMIDISERKRAERIRLDAVRLEAENARMHGTLQLQRQFLSNMSHELRTPLNGILGAAQLIESGLVKPGSEKFVRFVAHIRKSGNELLRTIEAMLDFAAAESGRLELRPSPVRLAALVDEVIAIQQAEIDRRALRLSIEIHPALDAVTLDPLRLRQVIAGYLSNAIKFSAEGGAVAVRLTTEGDANFRLEVEDQGIGIAGDDLSRLFRDFHQLSSGRTKTHGGTGLGLALVRRVVEAQGGTVGVRSVPGEGTVFHAVLPRLAAGIEVEPPAVSR